MTYLDDILDEVDKVTPKSGYNVCHFDEYDSPKLNVVKHFDNVKDAVSYVDQSGNDDYYIYNAKTGKEVLGFESLDWAEQKDIDFARKVYGDKFENASEDEQGWLVIKALMQKISNESSIFLNSTCPNCHSEDLSLVQRDGIVKNAKCNDCGNFVYGKPKASEASGYGIQNMLDQFIDKKMGKQGIEEVKEKIADGFSLEAIMELVATKLAGKLGKKLGVESRPISNPDFNKEQTVKFLIKVHGLSPEEADKVYEEAYDDMFSKETFSNANLTCSKCGEQFFYNKKDINALQQTQKQLYNHILNQHGKQTSLEYDLGDCPYCEGSGIDPNSSGVCDFCFGSGKFDRDMKTQGVEGGRGSGKTGHQPWMLGTYMAEECPNCMISTERDDDGKCVLCGN